jgi:hypothetical protein
MAYYIFLKSLRSPEEFRKNPHVKITPKSPSIIFQSLVIIKKSNFIQKRIFPSLSAQSAQRPASPSGLSAQPAPPAPPFLPQAARACSAHIGLHGLGVFAKSRVFFEFAQPGDDAFSLCHRHAGPTYQLHHFPRAGRPWSEFLRAAAPRLGCPRAFTALPHHSPPLIRFKPSVNGP